jgi:hypothetical protein
MIELQHYSVSLSAIYTWVGQKIVPPELAVLLFLLLASLHHR